MILELLAKNDLQVTCYPGLHQWAAVMHVLWMCNGQTDSAANLLH